MRTDLNVPFHEKDSAKSLGAWWDRGRKTWFVEYVENLELFQRWIHSRLLLPTSRLRAINKRLDGQCKVFVARPLPFQGIWSVRKEAAGR